MLSRLVLPVFVPPDSNAARVVARGIQKMPVWIYHGAADTVVPVSASRDIATVLRDQGSVVRYTELPGVGHNAWDAAYGSSEVAAWLLAQRQSASSVATAGGSGGTVRIVSRGEERGLRPRLSVSARFDEEEQPLVSIRIAETVNTRDTRDHDHVASFEERARR